MLRHYINSFVKKENANIYIVVNKCNKYGVINEYKYIF